MTLTEKESRAIDSFLGENWTAFEDSAVKYLTAGEVETLGEKLSDAFEDSDK